MSITATALRLGLLGVIVAAALAGVDGMTRDRIRANEVRGAFQTLAEVSGDARLEKMRGPFAPPLTVCDAAGAPLYRIYKRSAHGYGGMLQLLVGISSAGALTGVRVISHKETRGIGDAVETTKSPWIHAFDGKNLATTVLTTDGGAVDVISGASVTSRAVASGVRDALADAAAAPPGSCSNVLAE